MVRAKKLRGSSQGNIHKATGIDTMPKSSPDPLDKYVGKQVKCYRLQKRLSQTEVAEALGITFQQVQKYEKGSNRISSSRLSRIAALLEVPIVALFPKDDQVHLNGALDIHNLVDNSQKMRLLKAFSQIEDAGTRAAFVDLAESLVRK
jgi:transcriptional regulator with XRE-family HTH domain